MADTAHKAVVGTLLGATSALAGLLVGVTQLIDVKDVVTVTGAPPEHVTAWWSIIAALLTVVAGGGATGAAVYTVRNLPK